MIESPFLASETEGDPIASVGAVLSMLTVVDGPAPASAFPAASVAVAAATVIPTVPSPVHEERETVRVVEPVPETAKAQSAVPVLLSVTSPLDKLTLVAPE